MGRSGRKEIAGLFILFPIATVVGYYYLSRVQSGVELQRTVLLSLRSVPTIFVFLFTLYLCVPRFNIYVSLFISLTAWLVAALIVLFSGP